MPEINYANGKIYMITDVSYTKCYIGSTTLPLCKRLAKHKSYYHEAKNRNCKSNITSSTLFEEFGEENCKIELLESVSCNSREELRQREGFHIRNAQNCVNRLLQVGLTRKEQRQDRYLKNKETILEKQREYQQANKDARAQYFKQWYELNKEEILRKLKLKRSRVKNEE